MEVVLQPPTRSPDTLGPCLPLTAAPPPLWQGLALRISIAPLLARVRRAVLLLHGANSIPSRLAHEAAHPRVARALALLTGGQEKAVAHQDSLVWDAGEHPHRVARRQLDFLILQVVRGASPTRRRVGSCGWSSFQPGSRGAAVARAARLALTPARQPAGLLYRGEAHPGSTRCC